MPRVLRDPPPNATHQEMADWHRRRADWSGRRADWYGHKVRSLDKYVILSASIAVLGYILAIGTIITREIIR